MTVLRSREIVPTIKSESPTKTLKQELIMEPLTPAKALENLNHRSNETTPSPSLSAPHSVDSLGLVSDSVSVSGTVRRRSLRLISKPRSEEIMRNVPVLSQKRKNVSAGNATNNFNKSGLENVEREGVCSIESRVLDLGGKKVRVSDRVRNKFGLSGELGNGMAHEENGGVEETKMSLDESAVLVRDMGESESFSELGNLRQGREEVAGPKKAKGNRNFGVDVKILPSKSVGEGEKERGCIRNLRSGKKILKGGVEGISSGLGGNSLVGVEGGNGKGRKYRERESVRNIRSVEGVVMNETERDLGLDEGRRRYSGKEKGESVDKALMNGVDCLKLELGIEVDTTIDAAFSDAVHFSGSSDKKELDNGSKDDDNGTSGKDRRRFSREEKGKGKVVENDLSSNHIDALQLDLKPKVEKSIETTVSGATRLADDVAVQDGRQVVDTDSRANSTRGYKERFRDIARRNASRFAHFSSELEEENHVVDEAERVMPPREADREMEDWPGPFSTAMKIITDRQMNVNVQQQISSNKSNPAQVIWVPRKDQQSDHLKLLVPPLQELCMTILAKNADAITSLDSVPDALRHKLSHLLCDSRRMNSHFFVLLARGSPTEVRVRDCSWLTEEQLTTAFEGCDTNNLTVLQLDQCGRCMPDYILLATLARSSNRLPVLTTISLKGACRLSDVGLRALVSSAPALRSINLSQCSLVTSDGINSLAESLGPVLRELYIDDCQSVDAMLILPALMKLQHLEVLSLAGIQTVCDDFVSQFVAVCCRHIKELVLTDCVKLTDSSLKVIAENCSGLCAIDLTNLCKLTDSAIGYLANGCQAIQTLKLCRNGFSDEAIAAYLETCGEPLKELSLNNVNKVAHNTALSLARRSRNLLSLDLSWCRNLTNEAVGLIVDSCLSLKVLKLFGCTQINNIFLDGHSNPHVQVIGLKMSPILEHLEVPELQGPLHYSYVAPPM